MKKIEIIDGVPTIREVTVKKNRNEKVLSIRISLMEYGELCIIAGKENISISEVVYRALFNKNK